MERHAAREKERREEGKGFAAQERRTVVWEPRSFLLSLPSHFVLGWEQSRQSLDAGGQTWWQLGTGKTQKREDGELGG
jgi:hypothetical protein